VKAPDNKACTLTLEEAVNLLAPLVFNKKKDELSSHVKDKLRKRLRYAQKHGDMAKFSGASMPPPGCFDRDTLIRWAHSKSNWRGRLSELPAQPIPGQGRVELLGRAMALMAFGRHPDLDSCQRAWEVACNDIERLTNELARANVEVERLRKLVDEHEQARAKRSASARRKPVVPEWR
jgi:hypothetical protein